MEISKAKGKYIIYASEYLKLDSDVSTGGGTDETEKMQEILDMAKVWGRLHLIMDGAMLVSKALKVYSNTTIECMDNDCGFYLADSSDDVILRNADFDYKKIANKNITLLRGTYNHNCSHQEKLLPVERHYPPNSFCGHCCTAIKFVGVENLKVDGVVIINQRTYALLVWNWENVIVQNTHISLPNPVGHSNKDGLHFHGPGKNLKILNCYGRGDDDFIAINTDEGDRTLTMDDNYLNEKEVDASISDVLIDGIFLSDAFQAVRLLCWNGSTLENVIVRNITGTVRCLGFYICPYFVHPDGLTRGNYKNITFENITLKQHDAVDGYCPEPFMFSIGGNIENIVFRNISISSSDELFHPISFRGAHGRQNFDDISPSNIKNVTFDGLYVSDESEKQTHKEYIEVRDNVKIKRMTLCNISADDGKKHECAVKVHEKAEVEKITIINADDSITDLVTGVCENVYVL